MDARLILHTLRSRGATCSTFDGKLSVEVPEPDELDDVDVAMIRQHKRELIDLISRETGSDTDSDYDLNERAAIQEEGCTLTVEVTAHDLLRTLKAKGVRMTVHPGGAYAEDRDRISDIDAMLIRRHNTMLSRWTLERVIKDQTGLEVEIAEWAAFMFPDPEWPGQEPRSGYQVTFAEIVAPTPELAGLWALVMDHPPRLYRTPWRAAHGFLRLFRRHRATIRRYRRFGKLKPPGGLAVAG